MGKQALYTIGLTLLMATLWSSCKDDSQPKPPAVSTKPGLIYLINEGNFQWGNASLASYDPEKKEFTDKLYESVNGFPIGDVFQSMVRHNGAFYLVLNNSGKILQLDTSNLELKRTFSGFTSPRYMLPLQGDKALVTDLYSKSVSVLDLVSGSITKTVRIDGWTEQILQIEDEIWIGNRGNNKVYLLDANALTLKDSLELAYQIHSMQVDKNNELWLLCQGDDAKKEKGALIRVDVKKRSVLKRFDFKEGDNAFNLRVNKAKDSLFFLNKSLFAMSISDTDLPSQAKTDLSGTTPYGMDIDPASGLIYFSDAKDYVKRSEISVIHSGSGKILHRFSAGVICNGFLFPKKN